MSKCTVTTYNARNRVVSKPNVRFFLSCLCGFHICKPWFSPCSMVHVCLVHFWLTVNVLQIPTCLVNSSQTNHWIHSRNKRENSILLHSSIDDAQQVHVGAAAPLPALSSGASGAKPSFKSGDPHHFCTFWHLLMQSQSINRNTQTNKTCTPGACTSSVAPLILDLSKSAL